MIERVTIVPRWAGSPSSDWYPWLSRELSGRDGLDVEVLEMPNYQTPVIEQCVAALREHLGENLRALAGTILVGHSVGCQALMRYLASLEPADGDGDGVGPARLVCVAGWWKVDEPWPSIRPWIDTSIDLPRLRAATPSGLSVLLSDNDPFTADWRDNGSMWEQRLDADVRVFPERKHFNAEAEPQVLALLEELL